LKISLTVTGMDLIRDPRLLSTALIVSLVVNVILVYGMILAFRQNSELVKQNNSLSTALINIQMEMENLRSQIEYYKAQVKYYSSLVEKSGGNISLTGRAEINIVAVRAIYDGLFIARYEGLTLKCMVELQPGYGRVLVNTEPYIGIDLQASAQTAASVAEKLTGKSLSSTDIIVTVKSEEEVHVVDGPSAGAAITIAIIAAIRGDKLSEKVFITGTIMPDGSVGRVGGITEKAEAAAAKGGEVLLVPSGQGTVTVYRRVEKYMPPFRLITWEPVQISLQEYLGQKGYNMAVYEVSNVSEAYGYFTAHF